MAEFKLNTDRVISSMADMKKRLDAINKHNESLNNALIAYKAQFNNDISIESSKLINEIQAEIKKLNEEFEKYTKGKQDIMQEIKHWGVYRK